MKTLVAALALCVTTAFASPMGDEAVEIAQVLTHAQVMECAQNFNAGQMISVEIDKKVFRCPGCNHYTLTGRELNIDIPGRLKTLEIKGRGVRGFGGGFVQTYTCEVKTEE